MKKNFLLAFFNIVVLLSVRAQELSATVKVNTPKVQSTDTKVFRTLENQLTEFLNNTKWTDDVFETQERIRVNVTINIDEESNGNTFKAVLNIQASRPVYGTDYETPILNHSDKDFSFTYEQYQPIQYTRNSQLDNLSAVFSFYAFYILGLDYDTFSSAGGENHFLAAQEITRVSQGDGWIAGSGTRSRYWMMENMLSPRMKGFREAQYYYHRLGLDVFTTSKDDAQNRIIQALDEVNKANKGYPNAMIIQMFVLAKSNEIIEMAKGFSKPAKLKVVDVMSQIDPSNLNKYQQIGVNY